MRTVILAMFVFSTLFPSCLAGTAASGLAKPPAKADIEAKDADVRAVLTEIGRKFGVRVLVEKTVEGKVTLSLKDCDVTSALTAVCSAVKSDWRELYISRSSPLLDNPDSLAATVRLIGRLQFPDIVISGSSTPTRLVHLSYVPGVRAAAELVASDDGYTRVYVVTNDAAARKKEAADEKKNTSASKYSKMQKEMLDMFLAMSPEEQEQALNESIEMYFNSDPEIMGRMMQAVLEMNPESLAKIGRMQMDYFMRMPAETRRAIMRLQMESMKHITPEVQKILQEDAEAVLKEMQESGDMPEMR